MLLSYFRKLKLLPIISLKRLKILFNKKSIHSQIFTVSPKDCLSTSGFKYGDGWHPLEETARELIKDNSISYSDTTLYNYHQNYSHSIYSKVIRLNRYNFNIFVEPLPWELSSEKKLKNKAGNYYKKQENKITRGIKSFLSFKNLFDSIVKYGYQLDYHKIPEDFISVVILKHGNKMKYLIVNGNRRMAILSALKYNKIPVILNNRALYPPVVDLDNLENWSYVSNNYYSKKEAELIFSFYFSSNGHDLKNYMGL